MLFVTSHFYAWSKLFPTPAEAMRMLHVELEHPSRESPEAIKTIVRLRTIDDCKVLLDSGSTSIGRARSRVFTLATLEDCEMWVAIDDDCEASMPTLRWAIEACRTSQGICVIPYLSRREKGDDKATAVVTITPEQMQQRRPLSNGGACVPCTSAGFGLVFMHNRALRWMAESCRNLRFRDEDGQWKLAPFLELIDDEGNWYGEDISFFHRVPGNIAIEALVTGDSSHKGAALRLEHIEAYNHLIHIEPTPETKRGGSHGGTGQTEGLNE